MPAPAATAAAPASPASRPATRPGEPITIRTPEIIRLLETGDLAHIETRHNQTIRLVLNNGQVYQGRYRQAEAGKYASEPRFSDIFNLANHILGKRPAGELKGATMSVE